MKILKDQTRLMKELEENFTQFLQNAGLNNLSRTAQEILLNKIKFEINKLYFPGLGESLATLASFLIPVFGGVGGAMIDAREKGKLRDDDGRYSCHANEQLDPSEIKALTLAQWAKLTQEVRTILDQYRDYAAEERERTRELSRRDGAQRPHMIILREKSRALSNLETSFQEILRKANIDNLSQTANEFLLSRIKSEIIKLYFPTVGESLSTIASFILPFGGLGREMKKAHERKKISNNDGYVVNISEDSPSELRSISMQALTILTGNINALLDRHRDHEAEARSATRSSTRSALSGESKSSVSAPVQHYTPAYQASLSVPVYYRASGQRSFTFNYSAGESYNDLGSRKTPCDNCTIL